MILTQNSKISKLRSDKIKIWKDLWNICLIFLNFPDLNVDIPEDKMIQFLEFSAIQDNLIDVVEDRGISSLLFVFSNSNTKNDTNLANITSHILFNIL